MNHQCPECKSYRTESAANADFRRKIIIVAVGIIFSWLVIPAIFAFLAFCSIVAGAFKAKGEREMFTCRSCGYHFSAPTAKKIMG